jgi:hypothetical protein
MLVCRSQLLNESCYPPGYRWRKPAFPTMSGGRNGTACHDRQTYFSPQRARGALDLIAAVQQGDKIIMTFEETMAKLCEVWRSCRASPRRVQRAVAGRGYARVLSSAFVLDHLGDEVTMTIETNSRKVIGWSDGSAGARIVTRRTDRDRSRFAPPRRSDNV